ncbi:hypothetical protein GTP38_19795 [Duganella sp. FT94W]|uniref:Uncharacterized protein n=1 Tax=Duganella lactea TaxID=2692173 RepID=A0ABW9VAA2_9BURK|nr:hypothetical protein [Duganella lactea]MYM36576.1 hypothetical protein [Duganella lactea]
MTFPSYMKGNHMHVPLTSWIELKKRTDEQPYDDMIAEAKKVIENGGAFIVYRESDTSVMHRCDSLHQLNEIIG